MALAAASAVGPVDAGQPLDRDAVGDRPGGRRDAPARGSASSHQVARAHVAEPVRLEPRDEVGRRIVERRRPDVRRPADRGEQHEDLGQAPVEGGRVVRPAQPLEPVPERLALDRVVEQDRVAEVAQVAARDGVDPRLVEEQATHRGGVDRSRGSDRRRRSVIGATIAAAKPARPASDRTAHAIARIGCADDVTSAPLIARRCRARAWPAWRRPAGPSPAASAAAPSAAAPVAPPRAPRRERRSAARPTDAGRGRRLDQGLRVRAGRRSRPRSARSSRSRTPAPSRTTRRSTTGGCATTTLQTGESDGLIFTVAGHLPVPLHGPHAR